LPEGNIRARLLFNLVGDGVDEQELGGRVAVFGDQDVVEADGLDGVQFGADGGEHLPDDLLVGRDFGGAEAGGEDDVAVRALGAIAEFLDVLLVVEDDIEGDIVGPDRLAVADDPHGLLGLVVVPLAAVEEVVLGEASAGQHGGGIAGGSGRGRRGLRAEGQRKEEQG